MSEEVTFTIKRIGFDEHYRPSDSTRTTTNFANLARGEQRQENLRRTLEMIDNRFNALAHWDNPEGNRYTVELDIVSVDMTIHAARASDALPLIEILKTTILDRQTGERIEGVAGNNFSSYVRDYDFSVVLPEHNKNRTTFSIPDNFGTLHGNLFTSFINSGAYKDCFTKPPVICISVSNSRTYHRTDNRHPVLGVEYRQDDYSLTDAYFRKMGLTVRYFMPEGSVAPLAFYFFGDLLNDYTNLELISTISTMDTFQKIYRPEIYNANSVAGRAYKPSLDHSDYSLTPIVYDREERNRLGIEQGRFAEEHFIKPYKPYLDQWSSRPAS
ncbi:DUF1852 domain-containing protein [Larsenimonas rhizosphaerae]|uniref:DUF1852 domain-containing protein n=1 Tax=Larsenimonas rhizosphaerae TaxID=2944682 RepID=A0AA42CXQ2_9GAMM|nr:DUF1852 domain-containing protein [Larsenimonas rhizosphaerae]MCM2129468.1 DUF1852 domain-containing protein [Larsenimonas rhizosphaerae]MCX2524123.1 DUF1852 domain-containing protein [Larsenimonas rhizosphaerae]